MEGEEGRRGGDPVRQIHGLACRANVDLCITTSFHLKPRLAEGREDGGKERKRKRGEGTKSARPKDPDRPLERAQTLQTNTDKWRGRRPTTVNQAQLVSYFFF